MLRTLRRYVLLLSCTALAGAAPPLAGAADLLSIRGFGGWAGGYTDNANLFPDQAPIASEDFEVNNYYFTLNLLAQPTEKFRIHAQPTWQSDMLGQKLRLDLVYVEWTPVADFSIRAGKIKNPLGLYTEIYKVGTLRPFYLLPDSYYRFAPEGYSGIGLNRLQRLGSWEIEADLIAGQMDFESAQGAMAVGLNPATGAPIFADPFVATQGRNLIAGGLLLRLPVKGLEVGGSVYSMDLFASALGQPFAEIGDERQKAYSASLEYLTDTVSLRSELLWVRGYEDDDIWYLEGAYHLTENWQVALSYDSFDLKSPAAQHPSFAPLRRHAGLGAAVNYWFSPQVVLKLNYYNVEDNRVARPADAAKVAIAGGLEEKTNVFIAGVHFSF